MRDFLKGRGPSHDLRHHPSFQIPLNFRKMSKPRYPSIMLLPPNGASASSRPPPQHSYQSSTSLLQLPHNDNSDTTFADATKEWLDKLVLKCSTDLGSIQDDVVGLEQTSLPEVKRLLLVLGRDPRNLKGKVLEIYKLCENVARSLRWASTGLNEIDGQLQGANLSRFDTIQSSNHNVRSNITSCHRLRDDVGELVKKVGRQVDSARKDLGETLEESLEGFLENDALFDVLLGRSLGKINSNEWIFDCPEGSQRRELQKMYDSIETISGNDVMYQAVGEQKRVIGELSVHIISSIINNGDLAARISTVETQSAAAEQSLESITTSLDLISEKLDSLVQRKDEGEPDHSLAKIDSTMLRESTAKFYNLQNEFINTATTLEKKLETFSQRKTEEATHFQALNDTVSILKEERKSTERIQNNILESLADRVEKMESTIDAMDRHNTDGVQQLTGAFSELKDSIFEHKDIMQIREQLQQDQSVPSTSIEAKIERLNQRIAHALEQSQLTRKSSIRLEEKLDLFIGLQRMHITAPKDPAIVAEELKEGAESLKPTAELPADKLMDPKPPFTHYTVLSRLLQLLGITAVLLILIANITNVMKWLDKVAS